MKNTKAIITAALAAPVLALTGGLAYASTTTPSHPAAARATITATTHPPAGQDRPGWCDWRYTGHRGDWHNYGHQAKTTHQNGHHATHRHHGYRHHYGYQHRSGHGGTWSNQGYRYQGGWGTGNGSHWGNGSGCCRQGW